MRTTHRTMPYAVIRLSEDDYFRIRRPWRLRRHQVVEIRVYPEYTHFYYTAYGERHTYLKLIDHSFGGYLPQIPVAVQKVIREARIEMLATMKRQHDEDMQAMANAYVTLIADECALPGR